MIKFAWTAFSFFALALPGAVEAHAFGQKYTLPLPVWLYLFGGSVALVVSFLAIGYFVGEKHGIKKEEDKDVTRYFPFNILFADWLKFFWQILAIILLAVTIISGFIGSQTPTENFGVYFFWLIFFLGFAYLSAIVGGLWDLVNPFRTLSKILNKKDAPRFKYPENLGVLPAFIFFFLIIWLELLSNGSGVTPQILSSLLLVYALVNLLGVYLFGQEKWFKNCEIFSVFFALVSKVAPLQYEKGRIYKVRWLSKTFAPAADNTVVLFILFMLSSTAFDGLRGTKAWTIGGNQALETFALLISPFFFWLLYLMALKLMKLITKTGETIGELSKKFAYSLIPIALAYNVAHYYTLLLVQGQFAIPLASDPFNKGWNLFGTINFVPNIGIVGARFVWNSEVAVIVLGHVTAVYAAHMIALKLFPTHKKAVLSQIPMLMLMVFYTMAGLWILAQPLSGVD